MIAAIALMQAEPSSSRAWEAEAFKPYSECAMAAAKELSLSNDANSEVEDKALDACNNSKLITQLQIESHYLLDSHRVDDDLFTAAFNRMSEAEQKKLVHSVAVTKFDELEVGLRKDIETTFLEGRNR